MCGSLRREELGKQVDNPEWLGHGKPFWVSTKEGDTEALFDGHARDDKLQQWRSNGWKDCDVRVEGYTEGYPGRKYDVPKGYALKGLTRTVGMKKPVKVFKVVTRDARGAEQDVHPRFPYLIKRRF